MQAGTLPDTYEYIHIYSNIYRQGYIHMHTSIQADRHPGRHAKIVTYIQVAYNEKQKWGTPHIQAGRHTYRNTYRQAYIHTDTTGRQAIHRGRTWHTY